MTSRDFCYWLQGFFELKKTIDHREGASKETMEMIEKHLAMVFYHEIDPSHGNKEHQGKLTSIHNGQSEFLKNGTEEVVSSISNTAPYPTSHLIARC